MIMPHRCRVRRAAAASAGGGGGGAVVNAVNFDGTNDYLTRGAGLTGQANSNFALVSLWFKMQGGNSLGQRIAGNFTGRFQIERLNNNKLSCIFINSAGTANTWALNTTNLYSTTSNPGWHNLLISIDSGAGRRQVYIDDVVPGLDVDVQDAGNIGWNSSGTTNWGIGALSGNGSDKFNGDAADLYVNQAESLDLTVVANRRLFIDASGKPVDLGSDGSTPTGSAPIMFFSGATDNWHNNKGTGGGFTENGTLTTATTSPSD